MATTKATLPPNQSLYIKNLNEKIHKDDLKRALYMLFSTYGPVLDIVTTRKGGKGQTMRGQAHVCYRDIQTATQAMRALQGFDLFEKDLQIQYAKGESQVISKLRGTFNPPIVPMSIEEAVKQSIFSAPPVGGSMAPQVPQGLKRQRDEEDDVAMDDDDSDAPMDEDDDDD